MPPDLSELKAMLFKLQSEAITVSELGSRLALLANDAKVLVCLHDAATGRDVLGQITAVGQKMPDAVYLQGDLDEIVSYSGDA